MRRMILMSCAALGLIAGCEKADDTGKKAANTVNKAADKTADAMKAAADKTKEAGQAAADQTKKAVDATKDATSQAAKDATDKAKAAYVELRDKAAGEIQTQLDGLKTKLDGMKPKVDASPDLLKPALQKSWTSLSDQLKGLQAKAGTLKTAGADTWESTVKELKDAIPPFDKLLTDLTAKLGGK